MLLSLQVTRGQQHYLNILGVKPDEMVNLTRETASDLITHKLQLKEMLAPTEAQLKLLQVRAVNNVQELLHAVVATCATCTVKACAACMV